MSFYVVCVACACEEMKHHVGRTTFKSIWLDCLCALAALAKTSRCYVICLFDILERKVHFDEALFDVMCTRIGLPELSQKKHVQTSTHVQSLYVPWFLSSVVSWLRGFLVS